MRILICHEVTEDQPPDIHAVSEAQFRSQMCWLREAGYQTVQFTDGLAERSGNGPRLAAQDIFITFDDGYLDN